MIYKYLIRPLLFLFDPESIHNFILYFFSKAKFIYPLIRLIYSPKDNVPIIIRDIKFKNRLGLAAGFDKNGIAIRFWEAAGFSHVEIGTVTPLPQYGNPKKRIFRITKDMALINRLGFNNKGADEVRSNILKAKQFTGKDFIVGVNIGKNKNTAISRAYLDYKICFEKLFDAADYFTVNISSPNTEGLRMLHEEQYLDKLLSELQNLNKEKSDKTGGKEKNIFLKISPDTNSEMIEMIYFICIKNNITGIIATNTTIERENLKSDINEHGGLSGKPLKPKSDEVLKKINELNSNRQLIIIGAGGVFGKKDFDDKLKYGASLVQVFTGLIYEGPSMLKDLL